MWFETLESLINQSDETQFSGTGVGFTGTAPTESPRWPGAAVRSPGETRSRGPLSLPRVRIQSLYLLDGQSLIRKPHTLAPDS